MLVPIYKVDTTLFFRITGGNYLKNLAGSNKQCDSPNPEGFGIISGLKEGKFNPYATWLREIEDDFSKAKQQK